jgi:uncharacterized YceG family protein
MKYRRYLKTLAFLLVIGILAAPLTVSKNAEASVKKYGIDIADKYGNYTFYDLNSSTDGSATIEISPAGNLMVPLKRLVKLMPGLTYTYDHVKKTATVVNKYNGKKIVYTRNSAYLSYYASPKAKAVKEAMTYKMYVSTKSSSVLVHMSSLKWVMGTTYGYKYYKTANMQTAGYDTYLYSGLVVYNPYKSIAAIPIATKVKGISATVKVTIPEGYSAPQIFDLLVRKGVTASTKGLYDAMANYDFSYYSLVKLIPANSNRCFKLAGYLYPDTYEFYGLSKPQDVIGKFLRNTEAKLTSTDRAKAKSMGYSMNQILTVASMIEKETADPSIMPDIASVIYNRLDKGMKLQFDSTIFYVERYIKPYISGDINRYNSYYNTYKCSALPAGPISNPGRAAIQAALNPAATDYLYFYSDTDGKYHFSAEYVNPVTPTPVPATPTPTQAPVTPTPIPAPVTVTPTP